MSHLRIEINNTQMNHNKDIDLVITMYNLIEYSDNYSEISGNLWQYYGNGPYLTDAGNIINSSVTDNNSAFFRFKQKITIKTADGGTKDG